MQQASHANPAVLEFYKSLPFNERGSAADHAPAIAARDAVAAYPVLVPLLRPQARVLEVGCGTGWFSNSIGLHYRASVLGIDFNPVAVARAREVAEILRVAVEFREADLFRFVPEAPFDVVVSLGVLHHTDDCIAAVRRLYRRFVRPGGHVLIGLYHSYGRAPFLAHFREMKQRGASEAEMLARYRQLDSRLDDDTHALSWFRDQVLHPHETQHSLAEMLPVMAAGGMTLIATSINRFAPIESVDALLAEEKTYRGRAEAYLREDRYFPGFFLFLARKDGRTPGTVAAARP